MVSSNSFSSFLAFFVSFPFSNIPCLALFSVFPPSHIFASFFPLPPIIFFFSPIAFPFSSRLSSVSPLFLPSTIFSPSLHFSFPSQRYSVSIFIFYPFHATPTDDRGGGGGGRPVNPPLPLSVRATTLALLCCMTRHASLTLLSYVHARLTQTALLLLATATPSCQQVASVGVVYYLVVI